MINLPAEPTQSNQLPTGNEIEDTPISKSKIHKDVQNV